MATKPKVKGPTDAQLLADAKKNKPWLVPLLTDPEHGKTYLGWARDAALGKAPTSTEIAAATYNWDITQSWTANQAKLFNLSLTAPGEYKSQQQATEAIVDKYIKQSGNVVPAAKRQELINDLFLKGWQATDPRIPQLIAGTYNPKEAVSGTALTVTDQIKQAASDYMIPIDNSILQQWGSALQSGDKTIADVNNYFKNQAAGLYSFMSGTIDHVTPATYFAPLKSLISTNLGIPTDQIDFNEPSGKWMNLATAKDPKTGAYIARTNTEAVKEMRTNAIYGYDKTPGAIQSAFDLGTQIRSMMGFGA